MLTTKALIERAKEQTGLDDLGGDYFMQPFERLVDSINRESRFTAIGDATIRGMLNSYLTNRLEIEDWYRRHPEIDEQEIIAPTFITGLPRTGSTALAHMMSRDPATRSLRCWESTKPCPPPDIATQDTDPRVARYAERSVAFETLVPALKETLPRDRHGPDECLHVLNLSFAGYSLDAWAHIPSFMQWIMLPGFDARPAYEYHKRVLKLLQWRNPPHRWLLRAPVHIAGIHALGAVYPDARFVITHRTPAKSVASISSLMNFLRVEFLTNPEPHALGSEMLDLWSEATLRMMDFRSTAGEQRFFDMSHARQVVDPLGQIEELYAWLGWTLEDAMRERLSTWTEENPRGRHRPDLASFGLTEAQVAARFTAYTERFGHLFTY